jgi:hypothetical protein
MVGDGGRAIGSRFNKPSGKTICRVVIIKPRSNKGNILANSQGGIIFVFDLRIIINYTSQGFQGWNPRNKWGNVKETYGCNHNPMNQKKFQTTKKKIKS